MKKYLSWLLMVMVFTAPAAAETVTVDFSVDAGPATTRATGFLHGMSATVPSSSLVDPLKPKMFRCNALWSNCFAIYTRATALGAKIEFNLSDSQGYGAPWPGDNGDWSAWLNTVSGIVNQAKTNGQTYQWDIWNEPDGSYFWGRSEAQFFETWRQAFVRIRSIDPNAVIVGPSTSANADSPFLRGFLVYAKANNVLPDVLSWHSFGDGQAILTIVASIQSFMAQNGINIQRISLNEYDFDNLPMMFANFERAGIESAAHACWDPNCTNFSLDGIVNNGAYWWIYKSYSDITGRLVQVTRSLNADGVAGVDAGQGEAHVLLGKSTPVGDDLLAVFANVNSASYLVNAGTVHITADLWGSDYWGPAPTNIINADYAVVNNQVQVVLPGLGTISGSFNAYAIKLSPGSGGSMPPPATPPAAPGGLRVQ